MTPVFVVTLTDVITLILIAIIGIMILAVVVPDMLKQKFCRHNKGIRETRACDAICNACGKNLGFIGNWRRQQESKREDIKR